MMSQVEVVHTVSPLERGFQLKMSPNTLVNVLLVQSCFTEAQDIRIIIKIFFFKKQYDCNKQILPSAEPLMLVGDFGD